MVAFVLLILHLVKLGDPIQLSHVWIYIHNKNNNLEAVDEKCMNLDATSMHQSAGLGVRSLQSIFPWIKDRFVYEEKGKRRIMLKKISLLYNLKAKTVGINHVKNVYIPPLKVDVNEEIFILN